MAVRSSSARTTYSLFPWLTSGRGIFTGYRGVLDPKGQATAAMHIPNVQALVGLRIHTAFVTFDPQAVLGIKSISMPADVYHWAVGRGRRATRWHSRSWTP